MKTILPWLLFAIAAAGAGVLYQGGETKSKQIASLSEQLKEVESLRAEVQELKQNQIAPDERTRMNEAKDELLRLRNQVRQLSTDKAQLNQQAQAAQAQVQQVQAQAEALAQSQKQIAARAQEQVQTSALNGCLNNLRMLDAAKQQWALENNKTVDAVPTEQDVVAFLPGNAMLPCPAGGKYTLGNLGMNPTCSIAGHALPAR